MSWKALGQHVRELRLHICHSGGGSEGTRDFIKSAYAKIKADNPGFPFLIREAEGAPARITARYDFGVEESVSVEGARSIDVEKAVRSLIEKGTSLTKAD